MRDPSPSKAAAPRQSVNLPTLEALRGCLAVFVLLHHVRWLLWTGQTEWNKGNHESWSTALTYMSSAFRYGHEAVICFFVLSGFFIHLRWASKPVPRLDAGEYARRRAHRLLPPYAVALLATLALDLLGRAVFPTLYLAQTGDSLLDLSFGKMTYSPATVASALVLLPGSTGQHFGTNGPLWSLAYEFVYYALYVVWLPLRIRMGVMAYPLAMVISLALAAVVPNAFVNSVLSMYPLWLAGAALVEVMLRGIRPAGVVFFVASGMAGFVAHHFASGVPLVIAYAFFGVGVVGLAASLPPAVARFRAHRIMEYLGERSYTIYVTHFPLVAFVSAATFGILGGRPASGWLAVATVPLALLWCNLLWWIGERHFLHARLQVAPQDAVPMSIADEESLAAAEGNP